MVQWYQNSLMQWSCRFGLSLNIPATSDLFDLSLPAVGTPSQKTHGEGGILLWQVGGLWCLCVVSDPKWIYFFPWNPGTATVQLPSPAEAEHSRQRPVQSPNVHRQPGQPPGARHQQKWWGLQTPRIPRDWELQWSFTSLWWRNPCSVSGFPPGALGKDPWKSTSVFSLKKQSFLQRPVPCWLVPSWE